MRGKSSLAFFFIAIFSLQGLGQKKLSIGADGNFWLAKKKGGFLWGSHENAYHYSSALGGIHGEFQWSKNFAAGVNLALGKEQFSIGRPICWWYEPTQTLNIDSTRGTFYHRQFAHIEPYYSLKIGRVFSIQVGPYFNVNGKNSKREPYGGFYWPNYDPAVDPEYVTFAYNFNRIESGLRILASFSIPIGQKNNIEIGGGFMRSFDFRKEQWLNAYNEIYIDNLYQAESIQRVHLPSEALIIKYWQFRIGYSRILLWD